MNAIAIGGPYVAGAGLLVWAVETGILAPLPWVPGWILLGGALAAAGVARRHRDPAR